MEDPRSSLTDLSGADLSPGERLAEGERHATAQLIASLAQLDARRLYLAEGLVSLHLLHAGASSLRARRVRPHRGRASRTALPSDPRPARRRVHHADRRRVVCSAPDARQPPRHARCWRHRSKCDVEVLVASLVSSRLLPRPSGTTVECVRARGPSTRPGPTLSDYVSALAPLLASAPIAKLTNRPTVVAPLAPERYKLQFTVGSETVDKLRRVQDLLRHVVPDGDSAVILDRALTMLLDHLERTQLAASATPRASRPLASESRHIPARFAEPLGLATRPLRVCRTTGRSTGAGFPRVPATSILTRRLVERRDHRLRCKAHDLYEAEQDFGVRVKERTERTRLSQVRSGGQPLSLLRERAAPSGFEATGPDRVVSWCVFDLAHVTDASRDAGPWKPMTGSVWSAPLKSIVAL